MHLQGGLFLDIVIVITAAVAGGVAARVLRLPVLLGYLAIGMAIGPHALGVIGDAASVSDLAEVGVVLLLFTVGIEISFRDIRKLGRVAIIGGLAQILITIGLGYLIGLGLGWSRVQSVIFGFIISLSSTMVVLKILIDRGVLRSLHGRILTGMLLVQDLAAIPMIAMLPALDAQGSFLWAIGIGALKATVTLGAMVFLGTRVMPWLLYRVAALRSREVFVITLVALTLALAAITESIGISAALGAFVAGLILSESDFAHRALAETLPLRDIFSAVFFVSLGMLADPAFIMAQPAMVATVVAAVILLKLLLTAGIVRAFNYFPQTAMLAAFGMVQIGEFSFILGSSATDRGLVEPGFMSLVVIAAVVTMAMTPPIMSGGTRFVEWISHRTRWLQPYRESRLEGAQGPNEDLHGHVIVAGIGRVGSLIADILADLDLPFVVVDLDPHVVGRCRDKGWKAVLGASYNEAVLRAAGIERARLLVIATGDAMAGGATVAQALKMKSSLDIVARVHWREEGERLKAMGVTEVVWPEMEAGLEALRHSLTSYGAAPRDVEVVITELREGLAFGTTDEDEELDVGAEDKVASAGKADRAQASGVRGAPVED